MWLPVEYMPQNQLNAMHRFDSLMRYVQEAIRDKDNKKLTKARNQADILFDEAISENKICTDMLLSVTKNVRCFIDPNKDLEGGRPSLMDEVNACIGRFEYCGFANAASKIGTVAISKATEILHEHKRQ